MFGGAALSKLGDSIKARLHYHVGRGSTVVWQPLSPYLSATIQLKCCRDIKIVSCATFTTAVKKAGIVALPHPKILGRIITVM